jgi:hypothetical protein
VKFILNTAVDPHFCALFDEKGGRLLYHEWENRRDDGTELWEFLKSHDISNITFLGGVSGPGNFSSLRVGAGVLNSLAFSTALPVHSLRADYWQEELLDGEGEVVLNSFGDSVWVRSEHELDRKTPEEANLSFSGKSACVSWLSEEKAFYFHNKIAIDMSQSPEVLLHLLQKSEPHSQFITDYEVPPI